ncbi:flavin reductase family protein [Streptomyces sp. NPDC059832]|uniref:flavin reductase family protein n=1 Tax=unclassified Streptomyces TaxID=2593676 RepID=UPI00364759BC
MQNPLSAPACTAADEPDIRPLMASFPSGVSVIAALDAEGHPHGMTCSSLASVALSPPTIVACLRTASRTCQAVRETGRFALNLLHERGRGTSDLFSSGAPDRFERAEWRLPLGASGPHLVDAAHTVADCRVSRTIEVGDHTAVLGEVIRVIAIDPTPEPLLYGLRRYAAWSAVASTVPGSAAAAEREGGARGGH